MELWIRSQDKEKLVKVNYLYLTDFNNSYGVYGETGRYYGQTYFDEQTIYIDKDLNKEQKKFTLMHELGHCYIGTFITHQDKQYDEETVVNIVSNSHYIIHKIVEDYFKGDN